MCEETREEQRGLFLVVSAPSGTGKTTVCREVLRQVPGLRFSVSHTTRPPRPGEVEGVDYHFTTEEAFRRGISAGKFAEWVENYGHLYGTAKDTMDRCLAQGCDLVVDVEPRGARMLREQYPGGVFVFLLPPSLAELERRIEGRGAEDAETIAQRLGKAREEIRQIVWYDYIIVNERKETAADQLRSIYVAEKCRRSRMAASVEAFWKQQEESPRLWQESPLKMH